MDGGELEQLQYSDAGGLTQFGAYVEILQPGAISSNRHYHEEEDEFLYVISGEATVIEDDGPHSLHPGDAACWLAGEANAHQVVNRSEEPCSYLIFGTRMARDIIHYPDSGRVLYDEGGRWRLHSADDGTLLKEGKSEQFRPMSRQKPKANQTP
ncbi:MAG: cupin domain-containing protein [Rubrobacter sp.]|nr:cupin domain-containing protein [Rubrobacter sp.]